MQNFDYSRTAEKYEEAAVIQKPYGKRLLNLLDMQKTDNVLDLACGPGYLTEYIREITSGRVVGVDKYPGMISQAENRMNKNIEFFVFKAEDITFKNEFDIIFCSSAFHWFSVPQQVLNNCFKALKPGGKIGIQCPATSNFAPTLLNAVESIKNNPKIKKTFSHFASPWFLLEDATAYSQLLEKSGFAVEYAKITNQQNHLTLQQTIDIVEKTAAPGYLNNDNYDIEITEEYRKDFLHEINTYFTQNMNDKGYNDFPVVSLYAIAKKSSKNKH